MADDKVRGQDDEARVQKQGLTEDEVSGHRIEKVDMEDDVEGHRMEKVDMEDDVEGHRMEK